MSHARQQIRDRVVTVLTSATDAGTAVYSGHVYALHALPAINVTTPTDAYEQDASSNSSDAYSVVIVIGLHAADAAGVDDILDGLAVQVHQALEADSTLAGLVKDLTLIETDTELERETKVPHGKLTMRWGALYRISSSDPETISP